MTARGERRQRRPLIGALDFPTGQLMPKAKRGAVVHRMATGGKVTWCMKKVRDGVAYAMGDTFTCKLCRKAEKRMLAKAKAPHPPLRKAPDPLAGIPADLQAKMRDPAWRAAFNAPLTPEMARKVGMPPLDVLALMLARWLKMPAERRREAMKGVFYQCTDAERRLLDVIEAIDMVAAEAGR